MTLIKRSRYGKKDLQKSAKWESSLDVSQQLWRSWRNDSGSASLCFDAQPN